jgi:MFS family permease
VACYAFFFNSYNGPANGLLLIVVPSQVRGFTIALLQLGATLLGFGVAPFVVGQLSDMIGGSNSLGWALSIMLLCHPLAAMQFALAARCVKRNGAAA